MWSGMCSHCDSLSLAGAQRKLHAESITRWPLRMWQHFLTGTDKTGGTRARIWMCQPPDEFLWNILCAYDDMKVEPTVCFSWKAQKKTQIISIWRGEFEPLPWNNNYSDTKWAVRGTKTAGRLVLEKDFDSCSLSTRRRQKGIFSKTSIWRVMPLSTVDQSVMLMVLRI